MLRKILGILLLLLVVISTDVLCIRITNLKVPNYHAVTSSTSPEIVILDCEFEIDPDDTHVVLKWFFNDQWIYQWIPNLNKPHAHPTMKSKIDLSYEASTNPKQRYRALALRNPSWNSTGKYTCKVSSFESTDAKSAFLQIIDVSRGTIQLLHRSDEGNVEVECIVRDVFPQPKLSITYGEDDFLPIKSEKVKREDDGLFDVSTIASFANDGTDLNDQLGCVMTISGYNFTRKETMALAASCSYHKSTLSSLFISVITIFLSFVIKATIT